ncbi:MAG: phenylpropionate dioxygenase-like ring-hydroxylating dioxygenase large terminal subunit [Arenicella sp.]|jgi:phenylpropionate dioxygenase-like ring-hydroxylating dioxygenase large terminal subunit
MTEAKRNFIENTWYAAAWESQVEDADNRLARTICDTPLVFFKGDSGKYIALDDRCCHRAAPLSIGRVEGDCIRCMYHGLLYNADGKVIEIPGQDHIAKSMKVRSYPVASKGGMIWIWMGDPELADEAAIYLFEPLSDPSWRGFEKKAYMRYDANWLLIVDNLADFSHVAFVHTNTLGGSEEYAYCTEVENLEKLDHGFAMQRRDMDSPPAPFLRKIIPESEHKTNVDRLNDIRMFLPGVFMMGTNFSPLGWDKEKDDINDVHQFRNCQYMTPETKYTTHFFWDYLHCNDIDNPKISESLEASLLEGFLEDKLFIEEQQKLLLESPDFVPRTIAADEPFMHFRAMWEKALRTENEANPLVVKENKRRIL